MLLLTIKYKKEDSILGAKTFKTGIENILVISIDLCLGWLFAWYYLSMVVKDKKFQP